MKSKTIVAFSIVFSALILLSGCMGPTYNMPFNGDIVFHDLSLTIPKDFIRDSTQSNDDLWAFEKGMYKQIIILSRKDAAEDGPERIKALMEWYESIGGTTAPIEDCENAYQAVYTKDDVLCREVVFLYNDSVYAIAMRGATEEEYVALLSTISVAENTSLDETAA